MKTILSLIAVLAFVAPAFSQNWPNPDVQQSMRRAALLPIPSQAGIPVASGLIIGTDGKTLVYLGSGSTLTTQNLQTGVVQVYATTTGVTTGVAAAAGTVGEVIKSAVAVGSAASLTTATPANVTSISLTAGDWNVSGNVNLTYGSATVTAAAAGISTTTATLPTDGTEVPSAIQLTTTTAKDGITVPVKQINVSTTTTVYLVINSTFSAGTSAAYGSIVARRVR